MFIKTKLTLFIRITTVSVISKMYVIHRGPVRAIPYWSSVTTGTWKKPAVLSRVKIMLVACPKYYNLYQFIIICTI